jgi:alkylated DNA nucleotide flippase Atl1
MPAKKVRKDPENISAKILSQKSPERTASKAVSSRSIQHSASIRKKPSSDSFFDSVFQVARLIPKGRVSTYGAIAEYLGSKLSARMVGWAMNAAGSANPPVPAHRVVNRNGMLSESIANTH